MKFVHFEMNKLYPFLQLALFSAFIFLPNLATGMSLEDEFEKQYPSGQYILAIGQAKLTKNRNVDIRIATISARALIAQQIKVRIQQTFVVSTSCDSSTGKLFSKKEECQSSVVSTIEQTVEEILVGANPVKTGEEDGMVYAVVVLPLAPTAQKLDESIDNALQLAKSSLKSAKNDGDENYVKARDEYLRAKMLKQQTEALGGAKNNSEKAFLEMEQELVALKNK